MKLFPHLILFAILLTGAAPLHAEEPVYRETFNHGKTVKDVGWSLHINADAQDQSDRSSIALSPGAPTDLPPIHADAPEDELRRGLIYIQAGDSFLLHTGEARAEGVRRIAFYRALGNLEDKVRVAIRQGDKWYVSDQSFGHETLSEKPSLESDAKQVVLDFADRLHLTLEVRVRQLMGQYNQGPYQAPEASQAERWAKMSQALQTRGPRKNVQPWQPKADFTAKGTVYYVHPDLGNGQNDGKSAPQAFATVKHALAQLKAGDALLVGPGTYYFNEISLSEMAGTAEAPIYIRAEPRGEAIFSQAWPDAAEGLVEWVSEGDGLYSAPYPTRSDGEDNRVFGGFREEDGTPWFLFGYHNVKDLLADTVPIQNWDRFTATRQMPKPEYGFALDGGRAWVKLPGGKDPNGRSVMIASRTLAGQMIMLERSPHVIWDGLVFQGAGVRALRSDRQSPHQTFRNIVVEWSRNGVQPDSHSVIEWCEFTHPGYKRFADELEKLVADAGHRSVNPMFGFVKRYHNALTEGHLVARPWTGDRYDPPSDNILRHCLFYETFDGWNMGWQNSRSYGSVYYLQYDNAVELDAGSTPVRNIHFHDNLILGGHHGAVSQYTPVERTPEHVIEPLGPQYIYRNVIVGYHNHSWRPWTVSKFWTPMAKDMLWAHNLIWMKSGGLLWKKGIDAEARASHEAMSWLNNVIIFEEGITHQKEPERHQADGNALVSPEPRPSLQGEHGLHFTAIADLKLEDMAALNFLPLAGSPLVGAAVPMNGFKDYVSSTIGPFQPGEKIGPDWPRPRHRVFNVSLSQALTGSEAAPQLQSIEVVR